MRIPPRLSPACRRSAGFTLIEIMAVIAVIIILAGILIGVTGTVMERADRAKAERIIKDVERYLDDQRASKGRYPTTLSGYTGLNGLDSIKDPWASNLVYRVAENQLSYFISSVGADTRYGVAYTDDDGDKTVDEVDFEAGLGDDISNLNRE